MRWPRARTGAVGAGAVGALIAVLHALACTATDDAPQCNTDPWACPRGQTCWVHACACSGGGECNAGNCTPEFACMPSEPGKLAGEDCHLSVAAVTCGDRQACVQFAADGGVCRSYCDPSRPDRGCPSGQFCAAIQVGASPSSPTEHVCLPDGFDAGGGNVGVDLDAGSHPKPDVNIESGNPTA